MRKIFLIAGTSVAALALAACGGDRGNISEYEEPAAAYEDDDPVEMTPLEEDSPDEDAPEDEATEEDALDEEASESEEATEAAEATIPEELQVFADAIESARTPREVRAIYNNLAGERSGEPERALADVAAAKLNALILSELREVDNYEDAERLYEMTLDNSTARRMAQIKMETYPPEEDDTPSVAAEAAEEDAE